MTPRFEPTHLSKVFWPKAKLTKRDLIAYYATVSKYVLPYLKDRPLVLKRYPEGAAGFSFYQKDFKDKPPSFVKLASIKAKTLPKKIHFVVGNNKETLAYLANMGALELHPWESRIKNIQKPDYMIFDLDPGEKVKFNDVIKAALVLKKVLDARDIKSYPKTSGKRGLHVYVPLRAQYSYDKVHEYAHEIAKIVVEQNPTLTTLEVHPKKRKNKIFVDYLRNSFGQTAVAPYSTRATPEATVSTPLEWKEVKPGLDPKKLTVHTLPQRLKQKGDLWEPVLGKGATLK